MKIVRSTRTDSRTVTRLWAEAKTPCAHSNNGQLFFDGGALYSYGFHYLAGARLPESFSRDGDKSLFLINADKVSVTTSKHVSFARGTAALEGGSSSVFLVPSLTDLARKTNLLNGFAGIDSLEIERRIQAVADHMRKHDVDPAAFLAAARPVDLLARMTA
jgi:hypothetical protein